MPYYMPALPLHFINQFKPNNQSIDCTFSQLRDMANDIAKLSALGRRALKSPLYSQFNTI